MMQNSGSSTSISSDRSKTLLMVNAVAVAMETEALILVAATVAAVVLIAE